MFDDNGKRHAVDVEASEKQLNSIIEKRAKQREAANREEESWKQPTRQRRERMRLENGYAWVARLRNEIRFHHGIVAEKAAKLDTVLDQIEELEHEIGRREAS